MVTPTGVVNTVKTAFGNPWGLAFDKSGDLFLSYQGSTSIIREVAPGGSVSTFATWAGINAPVAIAIAPAFAPPLPVPEPASVALLAFASGVLISRRFRPGR